MNQTLAKFKLASTAISLSLSGIDLLNDWIATDMIEKVFYFEAF